jgi:hypothetical protein
MDNFFLTEKDEGSNNYLSSFAGATARAAFLRGWFSTTTSIGDLRKGAAWAEEDGVRNKEEGKKWEHALGLAHSVHGYILNK